VFSGASSTYAELTPGSQLKWLNGTDSLSTYSTDDEWFVGFCGNCGSTLCALHHNEVHGLHLVLSMAIRALKLSSIFSSARKRHGITSVAMLLNT
jgi:hypothetical protein